ncbi:hypothetical protein [Aeromonas dhakensis]|nr:hypothetical protein [Aeromonas dhakensis]WDF96341.1 hypothetical protein PUB92_08365 [Aeromonas dhakensis]
MDNISGIRQAFLYKNNVSQSWCGIIYVEPSFIDVDLLQPERYMKIYIQ